MPFFVCRNKIKVFVEHALKRIERINEYDDKVYKLASENTKYNSVGTTVREKNDEWRNEKEWDDVFEQLQKEKMH